MPTIATDLTGNIYGSNATNPSVGAYQYQAKLVAIHLQITQPRRMRPSVLAGLPLVQAIFDCIEPARDQPAVAMIQP